MRATSLAPVTLNRVSCLYCGGSGELGAVEDGRPVPTVRTPEEHTYTAIHEAAEAHDRRYVELLLMGYDIAAERHIRARDALLSEVVD